MATRWGIVSAGKISSDFVTALSLLPKEEHCVKAVAARDLRKAREFAKRFGIKRSYGSYEELAKDKDLDVIYIGSIHTMHFPLCKLFLGAGYNVLCEKPLVINSAQCQEVIALARAKNVFFMEAVWSRFFPVYDDLRKLLSSGEIGEPQFVSANFGTAILHQNIERLLNKDLGGGALLDIGGYPIQFVQMVYNHEKPKIVAAGFLQESGIDEAVSVIFQYSGHRMAVCNTSFRCTLDQQATICCSKMINDTQSTVVKVEKFGKPERMVTPGGVIEHRLPKHSFPMNFTGREGFIYEAQAVRDCLKKGLKEHPYMTLDNSLQICEIMDEIRQQLGVVYKQDLQK